MRESVVVYQSFYEPIKDHLSNEQLGRYFRAIMEYALHEEDNADFSAPDDVLLKVAYEMAKPQIEANFRRQDVGVKGGRPTTKEFKKPTVEEVKEYCEQRKNSVDYARFMAYYESNGWKVGRNPMKDWKAAVRNWEQRDKESSSSALPDDRMTL